MQKTFPSSFNGGSSWKGVCSKNEGNESIVYTDGNERVDRALLGMGGSRVNCISKEQVKGDRSQ